MNPVPILALYLFTLGSLTPTSQSGAQPATTSDPSAPQAQSSDSQPQAQPKQSPEPKAPATTGNSQTTKPAAAAKPSRARTKRHKKALPAKCSNAAAAGTSVGNPAPPPSPETSGSSDTT